MTSVSEVFLHSAGAFMILSLHGFAVAFSLAIIPNRGRRALVNLCKFLGRLTRGSVLLAFVCFFSSARWVLAFEFA